jgi:hypothetical protein
MPMTKQEHEMMLMMFARTRQMFEIVSEALASRGVLTGDDAKAFSHAVHYDEKKRLTAVVQTWRDYQFSAKQSGVVTGLEGEPPSSAGGE